LIDNGLHYVCSMDMTTVFCFITVSISMLPFSFYASPWTGLG